MIVIDSYLKSVPPVRSAPTFWVVVVLAGNLDGSSTRAIDVLGEAVRAHPGAHVLVDLSEVTDLDTTALNDFSTARSRAEAEGGALSLHGANASAHRLLEIWHLEPLSRERIPGGDSDWAAHHLPAPREWDDSRDGTRTPRVIGTAG